VLNNSTNKIHICARVLGFLSCNHKRAHGPFFMNHVDLVITKFIMELVL
jgi:hypothetical protein